MLECRILTREEDVYALKGAWCDLQRRFGLAPFTDFDYCKVWWETVGKPSGGRLAVAACFDGGELKGLLPFVVRSKMGVRVLRLIGHEIFYYRNFLAAGPQYICPLWDSIRRARFYDVAFIKNIHEDSPVSGHVFCDNALCAVGQAYYHEELGGNRQTYLASRTNRFRRKYKKVLQDIAATPGMTFDPPRLGAPAQDLVDFIMYHKAGWCRQKGRSGFFFETGADVCLNALCELGQNDDQILSACLRHDGKPVAATIAFLYDKTIYAHTITHDPAYNAYTPGFFLCAEVFLWAAENGMNEVNLMEGGEAYKSRFADKSRRIEEYVWATTFLGWLYKVGYTFLQWSRRSAVVADATRS